MVKSGEIEDHNVAPKNVAVATPAHARAVSMENVHLKLDEAIVAVLNRDGGGFFFRFHAQT